MTTAEMVAAAFRRIENRLIESMMRNLGRHKAEEAKEGLNWEQWQAIQLQELERYKKEHGSLFDADFEEINKKVEEALRQSYNDAETSKEASLLQRILNKVFPTRSQNQGMEGQFFGIDQAQLNAMIDAVENDFTDAEKALLRRANDIYRQTIFDAQVMAAAGMTYEEAVDMAVKDFLKKGIDCIEYKNGSRHSIEEYASMAIRTAQKRAYLMGLGKELDKAGIHTVRVNKRTEACPYCVGWLGRVLVDDVYSGGTPLEASEAGAPLLSQAMNMGFLHPNCKDVYSIYIPGVSRPADPWTKEEIQEIAEQYNADQEKRHAENMAESYERMAKYSLDPTNRERYEVRAEEWKMRAEKLMEQEETFIPAKSIEEAEDFARDIGVDNPIYKGLELETINAINEALHKSVRDYPEIKDYLLKVGNGQAINRLAKKEMEDWIIANSADVATSLYWDEYDVVAHAKRLASHWVGRMGATEIAYARSGVATPPFDKFWERFRGIMVNSNKPYSELVVGAAKYENGWHPKGASTVKSYFDHEVGHIIDYAYGIRSDKDMIALFNQYTKREIETGLSGYGATSIAEFIAEGYTEYVNSPAPREIARQIGAIIERNKA